MVQIRWISNFLSIAAAATLAVASLAHGQTAPATSTATPATPQTVEDALHQMSDKAGVIFTGQVLAVRRYEGANPTSGHVEIDFRVGQCIRGCITGSVYTLREWAGLWTADSQRYRVGQRLLMLLHTPGASGLSSPVDGMDGAIPIRAGGASLLKESALVTSQSQMVDLRWVGTKLLHPISYKIEPVHTPHPLNLPTPFLIAQSTAQTLLTSTISNPGTASVPAQQATVDVVVTMLTTWQKTQHAR